MNNKKVISVIAVVLAALMVMSLMVSIIPVSAYAVTEDEVAAIQAQKKEISGRVKDCKERLDALKQQQANVLEQRAALMEQNKLTQEQIDLVQEQIDIYNDMIADKAAEVEDAKTREDRQLQKYRTRVRAMEENGGYNILAVVLQSDNFSELLREKMRHGQLHAVRGRAGNAVCPAHGDGGRVFLYNKLVENRQSLRHGAALTRRGAYPHVAQLRRQPREAPYAL